MSLPSIASKKNRALLRELIVTDFKLRYQGSILGYLWSLLKPLFMFSILYVVFGKFFKFGAGIDHYPVYLLLGVVLWGFFVEATSQGLMAIVSRGDLIRKISFPKYIIVISGTISALINMLLNFIIVAAFMIWSGVDLFKWSALWFPLLVLELYVFSLALAFFFSALYVRFRDIGYIWEIILQAAFYLTPILYLPALVIAFSRPIAEFMFLNPVTQIIQDARYTLITHQTTTMYDLIHNMFLIAVPFAIVVIAAILASIYFRRASVYFAENI